jgi:hypothetical protein
LEILLQKFPYLPEKMALETLKCLHPLPNFTLSNPIQNHPILVAIQETKLTASKSTKYLQRLFPQYKMIFNNTTTKTQHRRIQGQPYNNPRRGLLTMIHQQYAFSGNITKIPTTDDISPYLQLIKIVNQPLPTYFLIHLYMPSHIDDIIHIPIIQTIIFNHIHNNPQSNIILFGNFNRDIALIGKQNGTANIAPTQQDLDWRQFTNSLHLNTSQQTQTTHSKVDTTTPQLAS